MKIGNKKDLAEFFIENGFDIDLPEFDEKIFDFNLYYKRYNSSITAPVAQICLDYQHTIYKIFCIIKYGVDDIRKLSKKEKNKLEVVFSVKDGSSNIFNILPDFKDLIESLPDNYKCILIALFLILTTGCLSLTAILKYKEKIKEAELNLNEKELELEYKKNRNLHATIRDLIDKLWGIKTNYPFLPKILNEVYSYQKSTISNLIDMDEDVIFNSVPTNTSSLKEYKKKLRSLENQESEITKQITDEFLLISIQATKPYFIKVRNDAYGLLDVYYDSKSMPNKQVKKCGKSIMDQKDVYIKATLNVTMKKNIIKKAFIAKIIQIFEKK